MNVCQKAIPRIIKDTAGGSQCLVVVQVNWWKHSVESVEEEMQKNAADLKYVEPFLLYHSAQYLKQIQKPL